MDLIRNTPAAMLAEISGSHFYPVVLAHLDWPGAPLWAHSNRGTITWDGRDWVGVGKFGRVDISEEIYGGIPSEFTLSILTDFPDLEAYTDTVIKGVASAVWLGAVSDRGGTDLIGAVEIVSGTADAMGMVTEVTDENGQTVILIELNVTMTTGPSYRSMAAIAHSHEDQSRKFPGDTAGRHLILAEAEASKTLWPAP